tara:strand:- start:124 stop:1584 length:1461 start_codon:yes stop_codon:yes gene_type:complete
MVKKKECYTKKRSAKNGGGNYTTCVEGQEKPKTIKIKRKKKVVKPKKTAQKKLSAGKSVLFTQSGFMNMVGAYAIPKKEKERREQVKITKLNKQLTSYSTRVINATDKYKSILEKNDMPTIKKELKKAIKMKKKYEDLKNDYKTLAKTDWKPEGTIKRGYRTPSRAKLIKEAGLLLKDFIKRATVRSKGIKNIDASAGAKVLLGGGGATMKRIGSYTIKHPFRDNQLNIKDFFQQFKEFERTDPPRDGGSRYETFIDILRGSFSRTGRIPSGSRSTTARKFMKLWEVAGRGDGVSKKIVDLSFKLIGQWANSSTYGKYIKTSYSYDDMKALLSALNPLVNDIENWKEASRLTTKQIEKKNNETRYKRQRNRYAETIPYLYTAEPRAAIKGVNNRTGGTWPFKIPAENHSTHRIQGGFTGKTVSLVNVIKVWPQLVSKYGWNGRWGDVDDTTDDTIVWRDQTHGMIYLINLKSSMASRKKLVNIIKT